MKPLWWMRGPLMDAANDGNAGGGGGNAFDPVKFKTDMMAEIGKLVTTTVNGSLKSFQTQQQKDKADADAAAAAEAERKKEEEAAAAAQAGDKNKVDPEVLAMRREIEKLKKQSEAAEKSRQEFERQATEEKQRAEQKDRLSSLRTELGKAGVAPDRIEGALRIFGPDVKRAEDGTLLGADDSPLGEYLTTQLKEVHSYLIPPKANGGAGATAGGGKARTEAFDMDMIKPGMKPEDQQRARAEIARVAAESMRGA